MIEPNRNTDVGAAVKAILSKHKISKQATFRLAADLGVRVELFDKLDF